MRLACIRSVTPPACAALVLQVVQAQARSITLRSLHFSMKNIQQNFFKDLTVIELASVLAGPSVGLFFAELGAQVIKIENKRTGGDVTRKWKLPNENPDSEFSAYYHCVNYRKEVQMLDLSSEKDRTQAHALIREADVVVSNYRPGAAEKLGMDYTTLKSLNNKLIYAQLNAYAEGDTTPAFDIVLQAEAGFLYMTGEPNRAPVRMPVAMIDLMAAHQLKEGVLLALMHRMKTGEGSYVSASLFESAVASLANQATNWLMVGNIPQRMGTQHPNIAPYGDLFICEDGKPIILAIGNDKQFSELCKHLNCVEIADDERFKTNAQRVIHRKLLIKILAPIFQKNRSNEILKILKNNNVPAAGVNNMQEVFELPLARNMILEETLPDNTISKRAKTVVFTIDGER